MLILQTICVHVAVTLVHWLNYILAASPLQATRSEVDAY